MNYFEILIIAIALSLDAFITMTANYSAYKRAGIKGKIFAVILIASLHASFALLGYFISAISGLRESLFFEYAVITLYIILAVKSLLDKEDVVEIHSIDAKKCFTHAMVTSFDAFAGGVTLSQNREVALQITIGIFAVTVVMVILGLWLGKFLEKKPKTLSKSISASLFLVLAVKSIIV